MTRYQVPNRKTEFWEIKFDVLNAQIVTIDIDIARHLIKPMISPHIPARPYVTILASGVIITFLTLLPFAVHRHEEIT
ncbi:MAG: hypothetical protein GTO18_20305 [Anaerolineales bacterium]|nr:hypothetical protein [Anaerolineales bacterium]